MWSIIQKIMHVEILEKLREYKKLNEIFVLLYQKIKLLKLHFWIKYFTKKKEK
jgi:hypothetical protein